jgi:hypothetical protein
LPRRPHKLTDTEREQWFVSLFIYTYGANLSELAACEKRAGLPVGRGAKILKRKSVKAEIEKRTEPILKEQIRQEVLSPAVAKAAVFHQEQLSNKVSGIQYKKLEREVLIHELMCGVVGLDWNLWPKEKLDVIKAGLVLDGILEGNSLGRRTASLEPSQESAGGIYTSLFNRQALKPAPEPITPQNVSNDEPADLYPVAPEPPPPPEASTSPPDPDIITVNVE